MTFRVTFTDRPPLVLHECEEGPLHMDLLNMRHHKGPHKILYYCLCLAGFFFFVKPAREVKTCVGCDNTYNTY